MKKIKNINWKILNYKIKLSKIIIKFIKKIK